MNSIPAQEIKRRGMGAVDEALENGVVHVIKNNRPLYVVLSEEQYRSLKATEEEALLVRVESALKDVKAGRTRRHKNAASLIKELGLNA